MNNSPQGEKRNAAAARVKRAIADLGETITDNALIPGLNGSVIVEALCNVQGTHPDVLPEFVAAYTDYVAAELEYEKC